jgi:hypothetical protein
MDRIATVAAVLALTCAATYERTGPGADAQTLPVGPWPTAMVLDRRTGHAFAPPTPILTGPGSVSMLDAATGMLLSTVVVGRAPLVMTVDDVAGHAIILNADAVGPRPGNGSVSIVAITP